MKCFTGTIVPELQEEKCGGEYTSTACIINQGALTYLGLPPNTPLNTILTNIVLSLQAKDEQIAELTALINP